MRADNMIDRDELSAEADVLNSRLGTTLQILRQRWHGAFNLRRQGRRHLMPILLVGAGLAGSISFSIYRLQQRKQRLWGDRLRATVRIWKHPNRVARLSGRTLGAKLVRRVALVTTAYIGLYLAKGALAMAVSRLRNKADRQPG